MPTAPYRGFVDTKQNPADKPCRWNIKKKWLKKGTLAKHNRSKESRKLERKKLGRLRDLTVQPKTKERYNEGMRNWFAFLRHEGLKLPTRREAMDSLVSDYLEFLWSEGEGRAEASTFLAGLQDGP